MLYRDDDDTDVDVTDSFSEEAEEVPMNKEPEKKPVAEKKPNKFKTSVFGGVGTTLALFTPDKSPEGQTKNDQERKCKEPGISAPGTEKAVSGFQASVEKGLEKNESEITVKKSAKDIKPSAKKEVNIDMEIATNKIADVVAENGQTAGLACKNLMKCPIAALQKKDDNKKDLKEEMEKMMIRRNIRAKEDKQVSSDKHKEEPNNVDNTGVKPDTVQAVKRQVDVNKRKEDTAPKKIIDAIDKSSPDRKPKVDEKDKDSERETKIPSVDKNNLLDNVSNDSSFSHSQSASELAEASIASSIEDLNLDTDNSPDVDELPKENTTLGKKVSFASNEVIIIERPMCSSKTNDASKFKDEDFIRQIVRREMIMCSPKRETGIQSVLTETQKAEIQNAIRECMQLEKNLLEKVKSAKFEDAGKLEGLSIKDFIRNEIRSLSLNSTAKRDIEASQTNGEFLNLKENKFLKTNVEKCMKETDASNSKISDKSSQCADGSAELSFHDEMLLHLQELRELRLSQKLKASKMRLDCEDKISHTIERADYYIDKVLDMVRGERKRTKTALNGLKGEVNKNEKLLADNKELAEKVRALKLHNKELSAEVGVLKTQNRDYSVQMSHLRIENSHKMRIIDKFVKKKVRTDENANEVKYDCIGEDRVVTNEGHSGSSSRKNKKLKRRYKETEKHHEDETNEDIDTDSTKCSCGFFSLLRSFFKK